jgi:diaminohydroxyphosphoribosylaminopyrimidine deaminase/5-amino-6-(5-phosphoribosylamino)uracil reductase
VQITGGISRAQVHLMRAESDVILVGIGTVETDDPELNCRLPGLEDRAPVRIVMSANLDLPLGAKLWRSSSVTPIWVFSASEAAQGQRAALTEKGVEVFPVYAEGGRVNLSETMQILARRGITRLLVEGGPTIWRAFADAGLVDEAVLFRAGETEAAKALSGPVPETILSSFLPSRPMRLAATRRIGDDHMHVFRRI